MENRLDPLSNPPHLPAWDHMSVRLLPLYPFRIILRLLEAVGSVLWVRAHFFFWGTGFWR